MKTTTPTIEKALMLGRNLAVQLHHSIFSGGLVSAENTYDAAVMTNGDTLRRVMDDALATRHLLVKQASIQTHAELNEAATSPLGLVDNTVSAGEPVTVQRICAGGKTKKLVAAGAIAIGDQIFTAEGGKVQSEPTADGEYWALGRALSAAFQDGDIIEAETCAPVLLKVQSLAMASTNGTAAAAADLAALAAETEKIGDDVRAIAAALSSVGFTKL